MDADSGGDFSLFDPFSWFGRSVDTSDPDPKPKPMEVVEPTPAPAPYASTFCDTLDYIFLSSSNSNVGDWGIVEVIPLVHRDNYIFNADADADADTPVDPLALPLQCSQTPGLLGGPLPNEFECSDHVMLGIR